jgi:hypothetical protein
VEFIHGDTMLRTLLLSLCILSTIHAGDLPRLKVSDNGRFLVTVENKPFFYLGDTAWEIFHRPTKAEAEYYLKRRAEQGFTVIQAVALAEFDGLKEPTPEGHLPLVNNDPKQPVEAYFQHVDWVVDKANSLGLYVGFLPTWGDKVNKKWGGGPEIFTPENARAYGEYLGKRYRGKGLIWILGGDRPVDKPEHLAIWKAMAAGLRAGDGGEHLITYHPMGSGRSRQHFTGADDVFDFHAQQNGHNVDVAVWDRIATDYNAKPTKPVFDMEPVYEAHPIDFKLKEKGHSNAHDIRKSAYSSVFSGGFGITYGHHSAWQFYAPPRQPINAPLCTWKEALDYPGANQMKFLRKLIESRPFTTRIPAPELVADPSAGGKRIVACRDEGNTYVLLYSPTSRVVEVKTGLLSPGKWQASLYDPRTGATTELRTFESKPNVNEKFMLPNEGENQDWVVVLDAVK